MKKALIVIDLQNDYFCGGNMELQGIDEVLIQTNKLIKYARKQEYKIYFVQHFAPQENATFFVKNTNGALLNKNLDIQNDVIIEKNYPNSFKDTTLKNELDKENLHELIICGAMTHMCIDTTVRAGFDLGYKMLVACDACATKDLEFQDKTIKAKDVQFAFMSALASVFCEVKETKQIIK